MFRVPRSGFHVPSSAFQAAMPEGDTIYRAARALDKALAGRAVTRFESVFPQLTRVDADAPLTGRTVERVTSRGKHLLMWFSGDLVLRTHMRMNGSWHIYRPGERWRRPGFDMRIVVGTDAFEAVAFNVPIAAFNTSADLERDLAEVGPDPLDERFDAREAVKRLRERGDMEIADALLDQQAIAGIGNVYKSEILFVSGVSPFARVADVPEAALDRIVALAVKFMRANVTDGSTAAIVSYTGFRRTTGRANPSARLWVYGRGGSPCRRCGTPIEYVKQGPHARSTYWCEKCQRRSS
jgi:endonuclease VIII